MPNIWHLAHQTLLFKLHEVCYMFYNFRTCYSTVSNMRRYGHKCHFRKIIFYSTFSLFSQYLIQCFLSLLTVFSLHLHLSPSLCWSFSLFWHVSPSTSLALSVLALSPSPISPSLISPRRSCHVERQRPPGSPLVTTRFATKRNSNVKDTVAGSETSISDSDGGSLGCGFV